MAPVACVPADVARRVTVAATERDDGELLVHRVGDVDGWALSGLPAVGEVDAVGSVVLAAGAGGRLEECERQDDGGGSGEPARAGHCGS